MSVSCARCGAPLAPADERCGSCGEPLAPAVLAAQLKERGLRLERQARETPNPLWLAQAGEAFARARD
jgi:hypothetical protein